MKIRALIENFLHDRYLAGSARRTILGKKSHLGFFNEYLSKQGTDSVEKINAELLLGFQEELAWRKNQNTSGLLLSASYRSGVLSNLRGFLKWLQQKDYLVSDFSKELPSIKLPRKLPRAILTQEEIIKMLELPDMSTYHGYRDRVLLEFMYATGVRSQEVRKAKLEDIDTAQQIFHVREGKGGKERMVPLGGGLCTLMDQYVHFVRKKIMTRGQNDYFFPGYIAELNTGQLGTIVKKYAMQAGIQKKVTPHSLRHACATHMMQNGAPIRYIQELLGHVDINTTQIYTHVTITDLKKAHAKYHPRERKNNPPTLKS